MALINPDLRAQIPARDSVELVRITRTLVAAITPGDSLPWNRYLAPDWFLTDEEGNRIGRPEFLSDLQPLPVGQHGTLTASSWHLTGSGTYVLRQGGWRQLASQVTALPTPIAGVILPTAILSGYPGTYRLTPALTLRVALGDSGLTVQRGDRPPQRLYALDDRLFIRHGVRGFWVFERDSTGAVTSLVHWRDNNPVVWSRER